MKGEILVVSADEVREGFGALRAALRAQLAVEISDRSFEDQVRDYEVARRAWRMPPPPPACYIEQPRRVAQWKTERRGRR